MECVNVGVKWGYGVWELKEEGVVGGMGRDEVKGR